jgi:creatinine amidohydrolase
MRDTTGVEYHKLRPRQLVARRTSCPVAYLPLGILEWHGVHNPLGLDGVKSHAVLCYLAQRLGGVVMPPLFWGDRRREICELAFDPEVVTWLPPGTPDHTRLIVEEMRLPKESLQAAADRSEKTGGWRLWVELVIHIFFQIESLGFKLIVTYAGHLPQRAPLEEAAEGYIHAGGQTKVFVLSNQVDPKDEDHAAHFETSLMMTLCPEFVELGELDPYAEFHTGVLGLDPLQHASVEFGKEILAGFESVLTEQVRSLSQTPDNPMQALPNGAPDD